MTDYPRCFTCEVCGEDFWSPQEEEVMLCGECYEAQEKQNKQEAERGE